VKDVLYLSNALAYDGIQHAGGQAHNYYLKGLAKCREIKILEVALATRDDVKKTDLSTYSIDYIPIMRLERALGRLDRICTKWNPLNRYGNMLSCYYANKILQALKCTIRNGYNPDIVIMEWTQMVVMADKIKCLFPDAKLVAVERDVSYLSFYRQITLANNCIARLAAKNRYINLKNRELDSLRLCNVVCPNNFKDKAILLSDGIPKEKLYVLAPYYKKLEIHKPYDDNSYDIIFYGAMSRYENYASAIWFIENVMPLIDERYRFIIVGSHPNKSLNKYKSSRIILTGYVEDVREYFQRSFCVVAPLILGAGIKIKVLESLYMGIPVLTNSIGIEGIDAENEKDYIHCEKPEDYATAINSRTLIIQCAGKGKIYMQSKFDYAKRLISYQEKLLSL
jgi:glycosyltransferase involved in cell wall biosynthesis